LDNLGEPKWTGPRLKQGSFILTPFVFLDSQRLAHFIFPKKILDAGDYSILEISDFFRYYLKLRIVAVIRDWI
jgi:hypothetical protein